MCSRSSPWQNRGKFLRTLKGDWKEHIGNDHGVDDTHIGQYTSTTATILKGSFFARTFANANLFL